MAINYKRATNGADKRFASTSYLSKKKRTPGTELVRVRREDKDGNPLDWPRALEIARARFGGDPKPYLADARWFAFEVPRG